MQISDWSVAILAIIVLINTLFIAGIAFMLLKLNQKVDQALEKSGPVIHQATEALRKAEEATVHLQERVDRVLERTTTLVDRVSERVDTTTAIAEEAVTEPLIGAASLLAGINQGLRTYTEKAQERNAYERNAHEKGDGRR